MGVIPELLFVSVFLSIVYAEDLLQNADFENPNSITPWECHDCRATVSHASYHGNLSLKITNRHHNWSGLRQKLALPSNHSNDVKCSAWIKFLNIPQGKMYTKKEMMTEFSANGRTHHNVFGRDSYHQPQFDWTEIGGDFSFLAGTQHALMYIQIEDPSINYLLDYASCQIITSDSQWKTKANQRIETLRKGPLNITVASDSNIDTSGLTVQIKQTKSKFAFGTAVTASLVTDQTHKAYQDFIYNNFEWAVITNALKWRLMEWTLGHPHYAKGMNAVNQLRNNGIKVRGHNMFWGVDGHVPQWLNGMSSAQLLQQMHNRVNGMISHSKGTLEHWDVNNENLHGDFFERHTGNPNITMDMFSWMHAQEPNVKLFLNEYGVLTSHLETIAYKEQGKRFKESKVPIYGMGVQSHFRTKYINMDVLKYRLNKVTEAGLPIWITELTLSDPNENTKAAALDDVMTLYFSHPAVEGVLLWGFWDHAVHDLNTVLATGPNVTANAAGRKWQELFHHRFRTNEIHSFSGRSVVQTRVFLGEYQLIVKQHDKVLHTETVTVGHAGETATVHLQGTGNNVQVSHVAFG